MYTVIIPCYNQGKFLSDAINSVLAQENVPGPVEVLVINDGSTDETAEVAASYGDRVRYLEHENRGLSQTRNRGLQEACHDFVIFLDSDDVLLPSAISSLHSIYESHQPTPALVAGEHVDMSEDGTPWRKIETGSDTVEVVTARDLVIRNRFCPTLLANRDILLDLGGFDSTLRASEDRDLWIRVATHHPVVLLGRDILLKRDHVGCISRIADQQTEQMERTLAKAFSDPVLDLTDRDKQISRAIFLHQSALMYSDSGDVKTALRQALRSFASRPFTSRAETGIAFRARLRCLLSLTAKNLIGAGPSMNEAPVTPLERE